MRPPAFEFRSRKAGDFVTNDTFKDALNDAVRSQRLADANISEERLGEIGTPVNLDAKGLNDRGEEKDSSGVMVASFVLGTKRSFDFLHNNPFVEFHPTDYVNDPFVISRNDRICARARPNAVSSASPATRSRKWLPSTERVFH